MTNQKTISLGQIRRFFITDEMVKAWLGKIAIANHQIEIRTGQHDQALMVKVYSSGQHGPDAGKVLRAYRWKSLLNGYWRLANIRTQGQPLRLSEELFMAIAHDYVEAIITGKSPEFIDEVSHEADRGHPKSND
ncbi:MAG: hypothetical protein AAF921_25815 [Cyanobacteria bacterium P01_D01_bin.44]